MDEPSIMQHPEEVDWLSELLLTSNVATILTIGVFHGGLEYQLAKHYQAAGRACLITGLDLALPPELLRTGELIRERFPLACVNFVYYDTGAENNHFCPGKYDFVFIDADHRYESVKRDFELVRPLAKRFVGFHDILDSPLHRQLNCYVSNLWSEVKQQYPAAEKITSSLWGGIGVVYVG